jgi:histidine ammonia-lyase
MSVTIDGKSLTLDDIEKVSFLNQKVSISSEVESNLNSSLKIINNTIKNGKVAYGINTGFGKLCDKVISNSKLNELQINLIRSHSTGVGKPLDKSVTKALMLIRANSLANGYSGIQPETLKSIINLINENIYPYIPDTGSLGASGDLAPLSHLALVLIGEGKCINNDQLIDSRKILEKLKLEKLS